MLWQAAHPGRVWSNWPAGTGIPVMDPVNMPWFAALDPALAWNALWMWNVALALLGGFVLGREVSAREEGGWIGAAVVGTSPFLHGMGVFGLTESWTVGWYALHVGAMYRHARTGDVRDSRRRGLARCGSTAWARWSRRRGSSRSSVPATPGTAPRRRPGRAGIRAGVMPRAAARTWSRC
jgi:hypothetical protein